MKKVLSVCIPLLIATVIAFVGVFVGSYLDLEIANNVGNPSHPIAILFTAIGSMPTIFAGVFGGAVLLFYKYKTKIGCIIAKLCGSVDMALMTFFLIVSSAEYAEYPPMEPHSTLYKLILIIFVLLVDVVIILLTWKYSKKINPKLLFTVAVLLMTIVTSYAAFTEGIKYLASRPRPRVVLTGAEEFRAWYQWKPFYFISHEDCKSFVSGHAANSTCLITILPLFISITPLKNKNWAYPLSSVIGLLFALVVAFSRMLARAHFLTDIMGGMMVSIIFQALSLILVPIIITKINQKFEK